MPSVTLADRRKGETIRLAEDTPVGGADARRWVAGGTVAVITGRLSGGWTLLRTWSDDTGWSDPFAVPSTARIATVLTERPGAADEVAGDRGGADVADPLQRQVAGGSPLLNRRTP